MNLSKLIHLSAVYTIHYGPGSIVIFFIKTRSVAWSTRNFLKVTTL